MFGLFLWQGWFINALAFYIKHIISNFNLMAYFVCLNFLVTALITESNWINLSYVLGYLAVAAGLYYAEYYWGTEAIRYLDNDYYADERLLPSLLYVFGLIDHVE